LIERLGIDQEWGRSLLLFRSLQLQIHIRFNLEKTRSRNSFSKICKKSNQVKKLLQHFESIEKNQFKNRMKDQNQCFNRKHNRVSTLRKKRNM